MDTAITKGREPNPHNTGRRAREKYYYPGAFGPRKDFERHEHKRMVATVGRRQYRRTRAEEAFDVGCFDLNPRGRFKHMVQP